MSNEAKISELQKKYDGLADKMTDEAQTILFEIDELKKEPVKKSAAKQEEQKPAQVPATKSQQAVSRSDVKVWSDAIKALPTELARMGVEDKRVTIEVGFATQIIRGNTYLQKCDAKSIYDAVVYASRIGLTLNPAQGMAYLVPRGNKCCLDVGYKGWAATLRSTGSVWDINAFVVRSGDEFTWIPSDGYLKHIPKGSATEAEHKSRPIVAAYTRVVLPNNIISYEVIEGWELEKIRKVSPAASSGSSPYNNWEDEMTKKAPVKRHAKKLQLLHTDDRIAAMFENEQRNDSMNNPKPIHDDWTEAEVVND